MDQQELKQASIQFEELCRVFDEMNLKYDRYEEDFRIRISYTGEDMKHFILIRIIPESYSLLFISPLGININPQQLDELYKAICLINYNLFFGLFQLGKNEDIYLSHVVSYSNSLVSEEVIRDSLSMSVHVMENYDDKLLAVNKGYLKADDIMK